MDNTIFENVTFIDTRRGELVKNKCIFVKQGIISEISDTPFDHSEARVIDVEGKYLMPGMCDSHVHVTAITPDFALLGSMSPTYVTARTVPMLKNMLMRGFTTVRDAGGADYGLAQAVDENALVGPRILFCGKALSQTGGHGDMRSKGQEHFEGCLCCSGLGRICDGVDDVRRACRDEIRKGATQIKIMASGGVASPTDRIDSTQFSIDEIDAVVQEAEAANIHTMAHAYTARAINRLLKSGIKTIEHGNLLDEESCKLFIEHDAYLTPTLVIYDALAKEGVEAGLPESLQRKVYDVLDAGHKALELAYGAGVNMLFGTDLLGQMERHQLSEFALRSQVVPAPDLIRAATCNAADAFGYQGNFGEIVEGARADILVVKDNPLEDIHVLTQPDVQLKLIMKEGRIYKNQL